MRAHVTFHIVVSARRMCRHAASASSLHVVPVCSSQAAETSSLLARRSNSCVSEQTEPLDVFCVDNNPSSSTPAGGAAQERVGGRNKQKQAAFVTNKQKEMLRQLFVVKASVLRCLGSCTRGREDGVLLMVAHAPAFIQDVCV